MKSGDFEAWALLEQGRVEAALEAWVPADAPRSQNTLYYILRHKSREAAAASWEAFRKDPAWLKARTESEATGKIVDHVESVFLSPADFSKLK